MNAPLKSPARDAAPPEWSSDLYESRTDPRIEQDLARARRANDALVALKGRFVAGRADPGALGALIDEGISLYEEATNALWAQRPLGGRRLCLAGRLDGAGRSGVGPVRGRPADPRVADRGGKPVLHPRTQRA